MRLLPAIIETLPDGEIMEVRIGLHWTAVIANVAGDCRCGLASTLSSGHNHTHEPDVSEAGRLEEFSALELARLAIGDRPVQASVGLAAINALLPRLPQLWRDENAEDVITRLGAGKRVVMVGHFPFVASLRPKVSELFILEQNPGPEDLPAEAARDVIPAADVLAVTSMTFSNHTLEGLLDLCSPSTQVVLLGPTTPLSPLLFENGVDVLSGSIVVSIDPVLHTLSQGANFRQVHHAGVRLVNLHKTDWLAANRA